MPTNGCQGNFKLGNNRGSLVTAIRGQGIVLNEVSAMAWMKRLQPLPKGSGKLRTARKKKIKELMQERYPHLKVINATADALAILGYGIEKETGLV